MTKQPLNRCKDCGYTWYPRGKSLSPTCPNCGGRNTAIDLTGCYAILIAVALLGGGLICITLCGGIAGLTTPKRQPDPAPVVWNLPADQPRNNGAEVPAQIEEPKNPINEPRPKGNQDPKPPTAPLRKMLPPEPEEPAKPPRSVLSPESMLDWHAYRTWTSADGKFTTKAKIKFLAYEILKLEKADGTVISIKPDQLSDDDQSFVQDYKKAMNKPK